jgi:hypothetical protein
MIAPMSCPPKTPRFGPLARSLAGVLVLAAALGAGSGRADLVAIEYWDEGISDTYPGGGPLWTGIVDTVADTLTIQTWTELPGHASEFWMPRDLPLVWKAYASDGSLYNVPDNFNGKIDDTFAFISDQTLRQMRWLIPQFNYATNPPTRLPSIEATYTLNAIDIRPGWGGYAFGLPGAPLNQYVYRTFNPAYTGEANASEQPKFDERVMPVLPILAGSPPARSDFATVSVAHLVVEAVPETRQWAMLGVALGATLAWNWRRLRRGSVAPATAS